MLIDLSEEDEPDRFERITDPIINRYGHRLHLLLQELIAETEHYELNREQIDQLIDSLRTFRNLLVMTEDLEIFDAMLRLTFPNDYYDEGDNVLPMLSTYPLGRSN